MTTQTEQFTLEQKLEHLEEWAQSHSFTEFGRVSSIHDKWDYANEKLDRLQAAVDNEEVRLFGRAILELDLPSRTVTNINSLVDRGRISACLISGEETEISNNSAIADFSIIRNSYIFGSKIINSVITNSRIRSGSPELTEIFDSNVTDSSVSNSMINQCIVTTRNNIQETRIDRSRLSNLSLSDVQATKAVGGAAKIAAPPTLSGNLDDTRICSVGDQIIVR